MLNVKWTEAVYSKLALYCWFAPPPLAKIAWCPLQASLSITAVSWAPRFNWNVERQQKLSR